MEAMYDLVFKGGKVVFPDRIARAQVAVRGGKIARTFPEGASVNAERSVGFEGCYLMPGFVDCHVHLNEPGFTHREDFYHGTAAAAVGGITTVVDMPMNNIPATYDEKTFKAKIKLLTGRANVDFALWGAQVNYNLEAMRGMHALGATSYKCFMCRTGDDYTRLTLEEVLTGMDRLKEFGGMGGYHCEDFELTEKLTKLYIETENTRSGYLKSRPVEAEVKAVEFLLNAAARKGVRVHVCHVSHPAVAEQIKQAKRSGVSVTAETCLHYLIFTGEDYIMNGPLFKCSPPLRTRADADRMWEYLSDGTLDCICSDHSPAPLSEKGEEGGCIQVWSGIAGVQTTAQGLFDNLVHKRGGSPALMARVFSENPARIFGFGDRKGRIEPGYDADLVVLNPAREWTITPESLKTMHKVSAFVGQSGHGIPVRTFLRGQEIARDGQLIEEARLGRFVPRT